MLGLSFTYALVDWLIVCLKIILSLTVNLFSLLIIMLIVARFGRDLTFAIYQDDIALFSEWSDGSMLDSVSHIYVKITVLCVWTCPDTTRNYQYIFIFVGQMIMLYTANRFNEICKCTVAEATAFVYHSPYSASSVSLLSR